MYIFDNYYTLSEIIKMIYSFIITKLFYKGARLIRRPFYLRGKPRMQIGKGFTTGYCCRFEIFGNKGDKSKKLIIGDNCKIGDNVHISVVEEIKIGDNCLMASKIFISDSNHGYYGDERERCEFKIAPSDRTLDVEKVFIGNNVWIGDNVCILKGVTIGDNVIIGANSVVNRSVDSNTIVSGIPARVIKEYDNNKEVWVRV